MKGERILYVILILVAIIIGFYGGLSGLFTPHHYYEVDYKDDGDCTSHKATFYINKRENYLIHVNNYGETSSKYFKVEEDDNHVTWETRGLASNRSSKEEYVWEYKRSKIDNTFSGRYASLAERRDDDALKYYSLYNYRSCSVTKQFLQRN